MPLLNRKVATIFAGGAIALIGLIVFFSAGAISTAANTVDTGGGGAIINPTERDLDMILWCVLAFTLIFSGVVVAATGLNAWLRSDRA